MTMEIGSYGFNLMTPKMGHGLLPAAANEPGRSNIQEAFPLYSFTFYRTRSHSQPDEPHSAFTTKIPYTARPLANLHRYIAPLSYTSLCALRYRVGARSDARCAFRSGRARLDSRPLNSKVGILTDTLKSSPFPS